MHELKSSSRHMETVLVEGSEGFRSEIEPFANLRERDEDPNDAWVNGKFA